MNSTSAKTTGRIIEMSESGSESIMLICNGLRAEPLLCYSHFRSEVNEWMMLALVQEVGSLERLASPHGAGEDPSSHECEERAREASVHGRTLLIGAWSVGLKVSHKRPCVARPRVPADDRFDPASDLS